MASEGEVLVDNAEQLAVNSSPLKADPSSSNIFTDETIDNLSNGFLEILQPEVSRVQKSLKELM